MFSSDTMRAIRAGYNAAWKCPEAKKYMKRKGIPPPGSFRKDNQHGGRLWGHRNECKMTNKVAGEVLERCFESKLFSVDQMKQIRHSLSYSYYLRTGKPQSNWPEVIAQWKSFGNLKSLPKGKQKMPTKIPSPRNLKRAFTTQWTPDSPWSLAKHMTGVIACWDSDVFGLRPQVDMNKVKKSRNHVIVPTDGYGKTEMVEGRSKLHMAKSGTRPWWVYRVCTCEGGTHDEEEGKMQDPQDFFVGKDGNPHEPPEWNTCCPVRAMEFLRYHQATDAWVPYPKWTKKGCYGTGNVGDPAQLACDWLRVQGQHADASGSPFDHNCGRKALAKWLALLKINYNESAPIHGDLEDVWRGSYQDCLSRSSYRCREQTADSEEATKALKRLAKWFHSDGLPPPTMRQRLQAMLDELD